MVTDLDSNVAGKYICKAGCGEHYHQSVDVKRAYALLISYVHARVHVCERTCSVTLVFCVRFNVQILENESNT
jgi:hypothetical protein